MKRTFWPVLGSVVTLVLLGLALASLLAGCSLSDLAHSPAGPGTTARATGAGQSSTQITRLVHTSTTAVAPATTLRPPQTSTTAAHLASGDAALIARKLGSSVVGVTAVLSRSRTEEVDAIGTGVIYSATGLIITNNHVVTGETDKPAQRFRVTLPSGTTVSAVLVGRDPTTDIAVLRVRAAGLHPALFRTDLSGLAPGDFVVAMGNHGVLARPVTTGHVTAFLRNVEYDRLPGVHEVIESSVALVHGNSGGPLIDAEGRVVGINMAEIAGEKAGITLPADLVIRVVKRITKPASV